MSRRVWLPLLLTLAGLALPASALAGACPSRVDAGDFASTATLRQLNAKEASFGVRATGTDNQRRFIDFLDAQMRAVPGMKVRSLRYPINRWDVRSTSLKLAGADLPVASAIPYSAPTAAGGVTAPLSYVGTGAITADNAAGKIVAIDLPPGKVPYSVFAPGALGVSLYDPDHEIPLDGDYARDFLNAVTPRIQDAAAAGAVGILAIKDIPRDQLAGFYAPYEGIQWPIPGAYIGADEGQRIRDAAAAGAPVQATLAIDASRTPVTTRTITATLAGRSDVKLVVESHTDGVNALWDNGPIAMIAMARYLGSLPKGCRPRTVEFAFVTGHLYQHLVPSPTGVRDGGAEQIAERLDREYDQGKVAGVLVLEHLGALEYAAVPQPGHAGGRLEPTGRHELLLVPVSESKKLRDVVSREVRKHDIGPTAVLMGADAPDAGRVPKFCSFGGEGTPYNHHLLPVVAAIAAPNTLFNPAFGMEAIDVPFMRKQTLAFTDVLLDMSRMSKAAIAGDVTAERAARKRGARGCPVSA